MMDKDGSGGGGGGGGGAGGGGAGGGDDTTDFVVSDIDALLARASRRVVVAPDGVGFGTATAASRLTLGGGHGADLDVHADNFWDLVLPGYQSPRKLLGRLQDPTGPLQTLAKLHSAVDSRVDREQKKRESQVRRQCVGPRDAFVKDVEALVDYLCGANSDGTALDMESLHNYGNSELKETIQLLTIMSTMDAVFTDVRGLVGEMVLVVAGGEAGGGGGGNCCCLTLIWCCGVGLQPRSELVLGVLFPPPCRPK
jgi:hypothetical protein